MKLVVMEDKRGYGWEREWSTKKGSVLYLSVWNYFYCPAATEVRRERASIDPDRRFHRLIWEIIVRVLGNKKWRLVSEFLVS